MRARQAVVAGVLLAAAGCSATPSGGPAAPEERAGAARTDGASSAPEPGSRTRPDAARLAPALAGTPRRPRSPREAVAQIEAADAVVRDRRSSGRLLAAAGHAQQLAYRTVADRPAWDRPVGARLPGPLRRDTRANVAARRAFRALHGDSRADLATELPAWRIVAPLPATRLRALYREAERRFGVEWEYLAAINLVETGFGRIRGTSVAGAQGPMQFIPTTWDIYGAGGDIRDPRDAILAAGRMLRANGFRRDPAGALYRYNNATAYVRGVTAYAEVMQRRPRTYLAYHQWPVYYLTRYGSVWLPTGYAERRPVPVRRWLAREGRSAVS